MWMYLHYFEHDGDPDCDSDYWGPFPYLLKHKKWLIDPEYFAFEYWEEC